MVGGVLSLQASNIMEQAEKAKTTEKELTREEKLELEEKAIQALLDLGVKFSVPLNMYPKTPPKPYIWWNRMFPNHVRVYRDKRIPKDWNVTVEGIPDTGKTQIVQTYVRHFHIKPLYLGTIDYIRSLYIKIEYDENLIQEQPIQESKKLFKYIGLMAEIAAVAVINDPCIKNRKDKRVAELKDFFIKYLNVSRLKRLAEVISQMMNAGGFTCSIRSIKEIGTTRPKPKAGLIE